MIISLSNLFTPGHQDAAWENLTPQCVKQVRHLAKVLCVVRWRDNHWSAPEFQIACSKSSIYTITKSPICLMVLLSVVSNWGRHRRHHRHHRSHNHHRHRRHRHRRHRHRHHRHRHPPHRHHRRRHHHRHHRRRRHHHHHRHHSHHQRDYRYFHRHLNSRHISSGTFDVMTWKLS